MNITLTVTITDLPDDATVDQLETLADDTQERVEAGLPEDWSAAKVLAQVDVDSNDRAELG